VKHEAHLDGWRGLAIGCVLLDHFAPTQRMWNGRLGVDLFFVLSGLLMSRILFEDRMPLARFYWRRASRILPVFLLFVLTVFATARILDMPFTGRELAATLTFTRAYLPTDIPIWGVSVPVEHLWSLNVEEHSYLFLSLLASVPLLRKREGYVLFATASFCLYMVIWNWRHPLTRVTDDYMLRTECAATGLLLSAGYRQFAPYWSRFVRPWMPVLSLVLGIACYIDAAPYWLKGLVAPFLLAFAVNHIRDSFALPVFELKALRMLGLWSFSIYLWQQPFCLIFRHGHIAAIPATLGALGAGIISFYCYEAPIRTFLNGRFGASRQVIEATKPAPL